MIRQTDAEVLDALRAADPTASTAMPHADALSTVRHTRANERLRRRPWLDPSSTAPITASGTDDYLEQQIALLAPLLLRYFVRRVTSTESTAALHRALRDLWRARATMPSLDNERKRWTYEIARRSAPTRANTVRDGPLVDATCVVADEAYVASVALLLLDRRDQELVRLVSWEELSVDDAGHVLGIRPSTTPAVYARALAKLARAYDTLAHV